jgi:dipeptidyl aminopeptidase/acylaminoacyl peptidase
MLTTLVAAAVAVQISTPALLTTIDTGKLKGEPTQLAWSPDGAQLFLQTNERDARQMITKPRYYLVSAADGKITTADAPPAWAADYWTWKSNKSAPGSTSFAIDIKQGEQKLASVSTPMGGDLARGGVDGGSGGTSAGDVAAARAQTQSQNVFSLTLKGESVGEFVGTQFLPGYTFGWSPKSLGMIVYANRAGHLAVMDQEGGKQQVESTKNVLLPAWSLDGSKIVFLQKNGKNKYDLFVAAVTP